MLILPHLVLKRLAAEKHTSDPDFVATGDMCTVTRDNRDHGETP